MASYPSMPLYTDAFIADTAHLTAAETGAYMMLLMCMWRSPDGLIPDNDKKLALMARCSPAQWKKIKPEISHLMTFSDGKVTQKRLQKTLLEVQKSVERSRTNGKKGGRPKSLKNKEPSKPTGSEQDNLNESKSKAFQNQNHNIDRYISVSSTENNTDRSISTSTAALLARAYKKDLSEKDMITAQSWFDDGCNLGCDILPTINAVMERQNGDVGSLKYFTPAIMAARDNRQTDEQKARPLTDEELAERIKFDTVHGVFKNKIWREHYSNHDFSGGTSEFRARVRRAYTLPSIQEQKSKKELIR